MPNLSKISATILVKNAQDTIKECLSALKDIDEIILLDNHSSDKTIEIARTFSNVKIYTSEFIGFGALKNLAISYAKNDWILSIDSDEIIESDALKEIDSMSLNPMYLYALRRKNLYRGQWIKACGWHPDYVKRLFNKNYTRFNTNIIHESVGLPQDANAKIGSVKKLNAALKHYAFNDISHLLDKLNRYSSLWAEQNPKKSTSPLLASTHTLWKFVQDYVFKRGFLYGYKGFVISTCNALGVYYKYMKLYENQNFPKSVALIITTYNQKERLEKVLQSALSQYRLPDEVLIADDGSKEDTKELIENYRNSFISKGINYRHIWHEDDGFRLAKIRNLALKSCQSQYVIIVDGDMILDRFFVQDHLRFAKRGVFVQGSRVILDKDLTEEIMTKTNYDFKPSLSFGAKIKAKRCLALSTLIFKTKSIKAKYFAKKDFIKGVRGCNMSFYLQDALDINGFNEKFVGWGREDSEFVARFLFNKGEFRRLRFYAAAYHLYHDENPRTMLESNHAIYLNTINSKSILW